MNYSYQTSASFSTGLPATIKKEDAPLIFKRYRTIIALVSFAMAAVLLAVFFTVSPKLVSLYSDLSTEMSYLTQNAQYIVIGLSLILAYFGYYISRSESLTETFNQKLSRYNTGDTIQTSELINRNYEALLMVLIGLSVGFLITALILPIYNLTSTF